MVGLEGERERRGREREIPLLFSSFSEGAGEICHGYCRKAIELSPSNPEAHQLLASCLLSQGNEEEAKTSLMTGVSLWLPNKVGGASSSDGASVKATPTSSLCPPYFSRISTAKLLLEVQEYEVYVLQKDPSFISRVNKA